MRRTFLILALATLSVGILLLVRAVPSDAACGSLASPLTGTGVSAKCAGLLSSYFMGYALIVSGLITAMLSLISMAKHKSGAWKVGVSHNRRRPILVEKCHP